MIYPKINKNTKISWILTEKLVNLNIFEWGFLKIFYNEVEI